MNQTVFLIRYLVWNQVNQPYIFIQQLDQYSNQSIIITINQVFDYQPKKKYYKISLINENNNVQVDRISGFKANGNLYTYTPNNNFSERYFAFYNDLINLNKNLSCKFIIDFPKFIALGKISISNSSFSGHNCIWLGLVLT